MNSRHTEQPEVTNTESRAQIYHFLSSQRVGVQATVDPSGKPYASVMFYHIDENFILSFATKKGTRKYENLSKCRDVAVVVFEIGSQTTAEINGCIEEISDELKTQEILAYLHDTSHATSGEKSPPISKLNAGEYVAYILKPKNIRMIAFKNNSDSQAPPSIYTITL